MDYIDRIYGRIQINEPVLLDLTESAAMQRLHGVLQHGISGLLGVTRPTTRFEHSLGAMILVRRLGASLEEQVAALIHDVSHTAFSHVIDYVFGGHDSQTYHEEMKEQVVANSDLPVVLAQHGYDWRDFIQDERFSLLEQTAPALCADRLDYFLRDSYDLGLGSHAEIQLALGHLMVYDGRITCDEASAAQWMAYTYMAADKASWANFREVGLYELTARAIREALRLGLLGEADIWSTDEQVWEKLHSGSDEGLQQLLEVISPATQFVWDENKPDFWVSTKLRTIDPDVLVDGRLHPLSELDAEFSRYRAEYLSSNSGKWPVRVVKRDE